MPGACAVLDLGASLLSWALLLVVSRATLLGLELDPWLFTFIQVMAGGALLVAIAGRSGALAEGWRNPRTWIYGVLRFATAAFFTAALVHTSTANAAFLAMVCVPIRVVLLWLVRSRRPYPWELPGHAVLLLGFALLAQSLEGGVRNPALVLIILSELCVVASTLVGELHPLNQTEDPRQRAGLTGIMLLTSAFFMLLAVLGLGLVVQWLPSVRTAVSANVTWLANPTLALDARLWVSAVLVGIVLRGPTLFLSLKAIRHVGTENYVAAMTAVPFMTLAFEAAAGALGLAELTPVAARPTVFGAMMILGSLGVCWARSKYWNPRANASPPREGGITLSKVNATEAEESR